MRIGSYGVRNRILPFFLFPFSIILCCHIIILYIYVLRPEYYNHHYGLFLLKPGDSLGPRPGAHLNPLVDVNDIAPFNLLQTYFFPRFVAKIVEDFPRSPTPIRWTGLAVPKPPIQFFFFTRNYQDTQATGVNLGMSIRAGQS